MPACTTPLEWPVWWRATPSSFSSTAILAFGSRWSSSRAVARPRMPAPITAVSQRVGGGRVGAVAGIVTQAIGALPSGFWRTGADSGEKPPGMSVRVRDLEIALVLAREMKAAAARSVDASLRLDQLQEVFGVERLDRAERARIQTALQMAGLEPFPSLLEADPTEPIRCGARRVGARAAGAAAAEADATVAPEPAAAAEAAQGPTFPTVGEFARSKLRGRSRRRFGLRRGDHGDGNVPPPPPPPPLASP